MSRKKVVITERAVLIPVMDRKRPRDVQQDIEVLREAKSQGLTTSNDPSSILAPAQAVQYGGITSEELDALRRNQPRLLNVEEKLIILEMYAKGLGPTVIATHIGRSKNGVQQFISKYRSTTPLARAYVEAHAEVLARRVVERATVEEAIDVLDRINVIPKRVEEKAATTQFQVIVGMPGSQIGGSPIPSQAVIEASKED